MNFSILDSNWQGITWIHKLNSSHYTSVQHSQCHTWQCKGTPSLRIGELCPHRFSHCWYYNGRRSSFWEVSSVAWMATGCHQYKLWQHVVPNAFQPGGPSRGASCFLWFLWCSTLSYWIPYILNIMDILIRPILWFMACVCVCVCVTISRQWN